MLQFISDDKGNTTGVFIPIDEWQKLKAKYADLLQEELANKAELSMWQKQIIEERLNDYYSNTSSMNDFDATLDDIEKKM